MPVNFKITIKSAAFVNKYKSFSAAVIASIIF